MFHMETSDKISSVDLEQLRIIHYPDPRLTELCTPVESVDDDLAALAHRMFELMLEVNGVGLAAPQVGVTARFFVGSPTCDPDDFEIYINPVITDYEGAIQDEEGCLSFPGIYQKVKRFQDVTVEAMGLDGEIFSRTVGGLHARIIQHELDHLDGITLIDKMGTIARMVHKAALQELQDEFEG